MHKESETQSAIVLAMFGTSVETALAGLMNIRDRVVERFPETPVRIAFTSGVIRRIWRQRADNPDYRRAHPEIPQQILQIGKITTAITDLRDAGFESIVVQAVYMAPAQEYEDLCRYVADQNTAGNNLSGNALRNLVVGRPALGNFDSRYPYRDDISIAAEALVSDVNLAREEQAALVYLGHGNRFDPAKDIFSEFAGEMNRQYPDIVTVVTTLEQSVSVDEAIERLRRSKVNKVLLKPFLIAAGGHVAKDMMGEQQGSLKNRLEQAGFFVHPVLKGLGEQDAFARIFVRHTEDAAQDAGIELR